MSRPALSPSRAADFKQCPLLYRLRAIDRLPEPPSAAQLRGSVVHAALEQLYTLPLGIMQFQGQFGTDWGKVLAFVSLALLPTVAFYLLAERQIIAGLTAGAVKE